MTWPSKSWHEWNCSLLFSKIKHAEQVVFMAVRWLFVDVRYQGQWCVGIKAPVFLFFERNGVKAWQIFLVKTSDVDIFCWSKIGIAAVMASANGWYRTTEIPGGWTTWNFVTLWFSVYTPNDTYIITFNMLEIDFVGVTMPDAAPMQIATSKCPWARQFGASAVWSMGA